MSCGTSTTGDLLFFSTFDAFFSADGVQVVPITARCLGPAAMIRAKYGFRALDAIHLAAAVEAHCDVFLTNDKRLGGFPDIKISELPMTQSHTGQQP